MRGCGGHALACSSRMSLWAWLVDDMAIDSVSHVNGQAARRHRAVRHQRPRAPQTGRPRVGRRQHPRWQPRQGALPAHSCITSCAGSSLTTVPHLHLPCLMPTPCIPCVIRFCARRYQSTACSACSGLVTGVSPSCLACAGAGRPARGHTRAATDPHGAGA